MIAKKRARDTSSLEKAGPLFTLILLRAFYKKYYQPDNVVLVVAGKFDEAKALALFDPESTLRLVKEILSGWESKVPYKRIDRKVADNGTGLKEDIVTPDKANAEYLAGLSFPLSDGDPDHPALRIGNFLARGINDANFGQAIVDIEVNEAYPQKYSWVPLPDCGKTGGAPARGERC